jgi:tetraacyldisaccharide 4'-kinase
VDIVIVTKEDLSGRPLPFGKLREPVGVLKCADALICDVGPNADVGPNVGSGAVGTETPAYVLRRSIQPAASKDPVFAVAGIAKPERFFNALQSAGYTLAETMGFGDHHRYSASDVARIKSAAKTAGAAAIVTTSKDIVRLEPFAGWPVPLVEIPLSVRVEPAEEFRAWLLARIAQAADAEAPLAQAARRSR